MCFGGFRFAGTVNNNSFYQYFGVYYYLRYAQEIPLTWLSPGGENNLQESERGFIWEGGSGFYDEFRKSATGKWKLESVSKDQIKGQWSDLEGKRTERSRCTKVPKRH